MLDLDVVPRVEPAMVQHLAVSVARSVDSFGGQFATRNLKRFLAICSSSFRAADWLREIDPKGLRHDYKEGRIDHTCPREEGHTDPSPTDRAFCAKNAGADGKGFWMNCMHASCTSAAARPDGKHDRAVLLDFACQKYGVEDAAELLKYVSDEAREEFYGEPILSPNYPMEAARKFIERCYMQNGRSVLLHFLHEFYAWTGTYYQVIDSSTMASQVWKFLDKCRRKDGTGRLSGSARSKSMSKTCSLR